MMAPLVPFILYRQVRFRNFDQHDHAQLVTDFLNDFKMPSPAVNNTAKSILRLEHKLF
jgi:hypothetical protein